MADNLTYSVEMLPYWMSTEIPRAQAKVTKLREQLDQVIRELAQAESELNVLEMKAQNPLLWTIDDAEFSVRTYNCLRAARTILTMADLCRWSERDLLKLQNFGQKTLHEVKKVLSNVGLELSQRPTSSDPAKTEPNR